MRLGLRDAVYISVIAFLLVLAAVEADQIKQLEAEVEDLKQCGRLLVVAIRDHPEVLRAIANETKNFTFYGCAHWADWLAGELAEKYNVNASTVFDLIWITGYFAGEVADHPSYHEPSFAGLLPDLVGALLIALPAAILVFLACWARRPPSTACGRACYEAEGGPRAGGSR